MKYRVNVDMGFKHEGETLPCDAEFETTTDYLKAVAAGLLLVEEPKKNEEHGGDE